MPAAGDVTCHRTSIKAAASYWALWGCLWSTKAEKGVTCQSRERTPQKAPSQDAFEVHWDKIAGEREERARHPQRLLSLKERVYPPVLVPHDSWVSLNASVLIKYTSYLCLIFLFTLVYEVFALGLNSWHKWSGGFKSVHCGWVRDMLGTCCQWQHWWICQELLFFAATDDISLTPNHSTVGRDTPYSTSCNLRAAAKSKSCQRKHHLLPIGSVGKHCLYFLHFAIKRFRLTFPGATAV